MFKMLPSRITIWSNRRSKMTCKEIGHSLVIDMNFVNAGSCRRCGKVKTYAGEWV